MHRIKHLSKKVLAVILSLEVITCVGLSAGILWTVWLTQQNQRLQVQAKAIATDLVGTKISKEIASTATRTKTVGKDLIEKAYVRKIAKKAENLEYVPASTDTNIGASEVYDIVQSAYSYSGGKLSRSSGTASGPNGKETYYNLNMSGVVRTMRGMGNTDAYWERKDGCKMLGNYIMVAANLSRHPRGSIVKTSLGLAIVCDTGGFASRNPTQIDVATNW
ncbi:MAG: hypothetical protein Q4C18_06275 [Eubacteriales bacterium]|nr:hypothetical protein [Eubacteriales bacterium]